MDNRVKKLVFQATHRGIRERELGLGHFVQKYLQELTPKYIHELAELLELFHKAIENMLWIDPQTVLLKKLKRFHDEELSYILQHPNPIRDNNQHSRKC